MSSFYGNYGGISSGSNGTSDYNDLLNKPIINIVGTTQSPIILNTLNYGEYMIKGSFIYTKKDSNIKTISFQNYILISKDEVTLKKLAKYETFEDGQYYIYIIYFNENDTCLQDKIPITKSGGIIFLSEKELPSEGVESVLYVTEKSMYQWKDDNFIDMNIPQWGNF